MSGDPPPETLPGAAPPSGPSSAPSSGPSAGQGGGRVAAGLGLTLLLHLLLVPIGLLGGLIVCGVESASRGSSGADVQLCMLIGAGVVLVSIGISQLVYMVPAIIIAGRRRAVSVQQGLIIGAVVTFLLNAGCWGLLAVSARF